jgi:hypothetical protein
MVAPTRFGIILTSSGSVPSAMWGISIEEQSTEYCGWAFLVTWCVAIWDRHAPRHYYSHNKVLVIHIFPQHISPVFFTLFPPWNPRTHVIISGIFNRGLFTDALKCGRPYTMTSAERCALFDTPVSNSKRAVFFTAVNIIAVVLQQAPYLHVINLRVMTYRCRKLPAYKFYW